MVSRRVATLLVATLIVLAGCSAGEQLTPGPTATEQPTAAQTQQSATATAPNGTLEVHFINVGQSLSTLVVGPTGETMLIDTGDWRDDGQLVLAYLQRHGISRIDYLVSSHGDADHIGGNAAVIEYFETEADGVGAIYDQGLASSSQTYERYLDAVERHEVTLYRTQAGDRIPMDGVEATVLGPPEGYLDSPERNENSVVVKLTYGETSFLFTGDAEDDGERYLVETYGADLGATVLKAGHHGSKSSTSDALLDVVDPEAVVISSSYDSQYGHPDPVVLDRLASRSIPTYWTATHGDIVLASTGEQVTVQTQRAAPTEATAIRSGDPVEPGLDEPVAARARLLPGETETPDGEPATVVSREGTFTLAAVNADAAGDDGTNLNDEYLVLENTGDGTLSLGNYTVSDASDRVYTIPTGTELSPGESITIHSGAGVDTATDLYWDAGRPVWNNDGDTVTIRDADGTVVLREDY